MPSVDARTQHWQRRLRLTGLLLALWCCASFGVAFFARSVSFELFGAPLGVWFAGQGALLVFVLIVWANALVTAREDRDFESRPDEPT